MFNNIALDIFIGLIFVFLLYSLLATIIQEIIATRFAFRAKVLEKAIIRMLEDGKSAENIPYMDRIIGILHLFNLKSILKDKKVAPWFYAHPLIKYLAEDNWYSKPAYLSPANFSKVMLDLLKGMDNPSSQSIQAINDSIQAGVIHKLPISLRDKANPAIKKIIKSTSDAQDDLIEINQNTALFLKSLWVDSGADIIVFQAKLEDWYNDTMQRATGWFKKYTRIVLFFIGFALAYAFNVDALAIRSILTNNRSAREDMVKLAIASQPNLDPEKLLAGDSSKLDSTYRLVVADAQKANNVLGLGKPWKDSLKKWNDSLKNTDFLNRFSTIEKMSLAKLDSIQILKTGISNSTSLLKNLQLRLKNSQDSTALLDSIAIRNDLIQQEKNHLTEITTSLNEYYRMKDFKERSLYIQEKVKDKWFLYSPYQAGGLKTFIGWLITAFAIMLGAPFWFDLLGKLVSLRGSGTKINSSDKTKSQVPPAAGDKLSGTQSSGLNNNSDQEAVG